ncbi:sugar ABC transporter permease [Paenibacillus aquistagni]|uniref:Putative aldouronate transport system permease protein n=2 Tax=Paenibacillus aquistagni TaxID=1852522 RepID=A0A1X7JWD5_9BACL|nr:ABC transporter permease subunit [Paenibacillus aquistagni]NMM54888.1 sugar ABC transporter permease [Paenibacillus aquistagni]SMG32749.1 putative aldouronate transport system permease protein [Paenibacillus aquistagni]
MSNTAQTQPATVVKPRSSKRVSTFPLHLMLIPGVIVTLIYAYGPMFGLVMAFQKYVPTKGFLGSKWVGFKNFEYIFHMPDFYQVLWNTLIIAVLKIIFGLLVPLILALLLQEVAKNWIVRTIQTSVFLPYFLSWTILAGVIFEIFSLNGPVNSLIASMGSDPIMFMGDKNWFRGILIGSDVWKGMGYNMILYLAAIIGINPNLYEAAEIDGAGRWKQVIHITLPGIAPIIVLLATLSLGSVLNAGFEQILLLYNPLVYESADVIDTLVYRMGLIDQQFSPAAAFGLFKSVVSVVLVSISYYMAYRFTNYRIF